jgi:dolichol-phosphate mannosyltransferase
MFDVPHTRCFPLGRPDVSVVICTLNEAASIGRVLGAMRSALDAGLNGRSFELIVVDDSADEATGDVVRGVALDDGRVRLIRRRGQRGLASAAIAGWDASRGEILGIMDGDGQHDPRMLSRLVEHLGVADVAVGSRYLPGTDTGLSGLRKLISQAGTAASRALIGAAVTDPLSGLFVMRRDWYAAARPRLSGLGFKILADVLACGPKAPVVVELPTRLGYRIGGESKLDLRIMAELAGQLVQARTQGLIPGRFVMFALVGATGIVSHMVVLLALTLAGAPFWASQLAAIGVAMTGNFLLNNALTFRDLRLSGTAMWQGLMGFYLACAGGALIAEIVGTGLDRLGAPLVLAGLSGAVCAAMWNYWSASRAAWNYPPATEASTSAAQASPFRITASGA